jgi:hypothetical protein
MTDDEYIHACWGMEESGGHFCQKLAQLYYVADGANRLLLRINFYSYFEKGLQDYEFLTRRRLVNRTG